MTDAKLSTRASARQGCRLKVGAFVALSLVTLAHQGLSQQPDTAPQVSDTAPFPPDLKTLSVEELMNVVVTSVSRRAEPLSHAASAIQVITQLPDQDGLKVLTQLKAHPETRQIPVVVVSISENRELGFSLGAVDWLVKPANRDDFLTAVRRAVGRSDTAVAPTVLVIDDERPTVELLTDMLTTQGFRVLAAHEGRQGIALARAERPDLIVLDLVMPGLTGFDVVQELREHPESREIPILIFTVKDLSPEERDRLQGSVQAVVTKGGSENLLRELARLQSTNGRRHERDKPFML